MRLRFLFLGLSAFACSTSRDESDSHLAIDGDKALIPGVVAVCRDNEIPCATGVLIAQDIVLTTRSVTSADSIDDNLDEKTTRGCDKRFLNPLPPSHLQVRWWDAVSKDQDRGIASVKKVVQLGAGTAPSLRKTRGLDERCGADVALVVLDKPLSGKRGYMAPARWSTSLTNYWIAGYGATSGWDRGGSDSYFLRLATATPECVGAQCTEKNLRNTGLPRADVHAANEGVFRGPVCDHGDIGAPLYGQNEKGEWVVAGIHVFRSPGTGLVHNGVCDEKAIFLRLDAFESEIVSLVRAHTTAPPEWLTAPGDGGAADASDSDANPYANVVSGSDAGSDALSDAAADDAGEIIETGDDLPPVEAFTPDASSKTKARNANADDSNQGCNAAPSGAGGAGFALLGLAMVLGRRRRA